MTTALPHWPARALLVFSPVLAALGAGCIVTDPGVTGKACDESHACPSPLVCLDQVCVALDAGTGQSDSGPPLPGLDGSLPDGAVLPRDAGALPDAALATDAGEALTHSLTGTVSGATAGATISLSGPSSTTTTTAGGGTYSFAGLANGSYVVTPSLGGYTFSPTSRTVPVSGADVTGVNFTAATSCQNGEIVPHSEMTASATSNQPGYPPALAIDGLATTFWHTPWNGTTSQPTEPLPQSITLSLGGTYSISAIRYVPPDQAGDNGIITTYNLFVSTNGTSFTLVTSGTWAQDKTEKRVSLTQVSASHVRLEAAAGFGGFAAAGEINIEKYCPNPTCTETDQDFCSRLGKNCESVTGADKCGTARTVASCGACSPPQTCAGGGTPNVCGGGGAVYYVAQTGTDVPANGSSGSPWKTLAYACGRVSSAGDTIFVRAGNYLETSECFLKEGVNLTGEGESTWIKSHVQSTRGGGGISGAAITLRSASEGASGNQTISNIKLDGDNQVGSADGAVAYVGILVHRRSNVRIHDCTIVNFFTGGIALHGADAPYTAPSAYATGNEIYNCTIKDCAYLSDISFGGGCMIEIGGQEGTLIHDNTLTNSGNGYYGDILSGVYYFKGIKYYNNKSYKQQNSNGNWNFHIELWDCEGGFEINNNEFHDGDTHIDIAGHFNTKGVYDYSYYIHDNLFTGTPSQSYQAKLGIDLENELVLDVWIYRNHFLNWPSPINVTNGNDANVKIGRIYICYNLFEKCGWNDSAYYINLVNFNVPGDMTVSDFFFYNNIISGDGVTHTTAIKLDNRGSISNLNITNNIIINHDNGTWLDVDNNGTIDGLHVDYNILFNNANNSDPVFQFNAVGNYTFLNNLKVDPAFVSPTDFHPTSPRSGVQVTLPAAWTDFAGNAIGNPPEIGIF